MCCVKLITLVLSNSGHYKPQWAHVLSCVNSAQRCVAQCRRATGLSRHTVLCYPVSVCAICKTKGGSFSNEACVRQLPHCTVVFGARGSKMVRAALRSWHTLVIHPILQTRTHMPKCIEWCSVIVQCFIISVNSLAAVWNMCITSPCTFWCRFRHYGCVSVQTTNKFTWISAWNICCSMKKREMCFWIVLSKTISPGVCTMIQRLNAQISSGNIHHIPHPALVR